MLYHYTSENNWDIISLENKLKPSVPKFDSNPKGVYLTDLPPSTDDLILFEQFYKIKPKDGIKTPKFEICLCLDEKKFEYKQLRQNVFYSENEIDLIICLSNVIDRY